MMTSEMSLRVAVIAALTLTQGCIATRDYVHETLDPVTGRVSHSEARLDRVDSQISGLACIIHESREQTRSGGILRDVRGA